MAPTKQPKAEEGSALQVCQASDADSHALNVGYVEPLSQTDLEPDRGALVRFHAGFEGYASCEVQVVPSLEPRLKAGYPTCAMVKTPRTEII